MTKPTPWNFSNTDKNKLSPNGKYKVEFHNLYEIAMGAPVGGECYLIYGNNKIKLSEWCGAPVIWNATSDKVALPIWTKQRKQKIAIVDISDFTITIFNKEFRVLQFNKFIDNVLSGVDSPIYMPKKLTFDILNEKIEAIQQLKKFI